MGAQAGQLNPFTAMIETEYSSNKAAANQVEADAYYNAQLKKEEGVRLRKTQQASYAASGVELEGSAALVITEDEANANIEAMNMIYAGKSKSAMMKSQARIARAKGYMELGKEGAKMAASGGM